jgi:hypothetical protein
MSQIEYHDQAERLLWSHGIIERSLRSPLEQDEVDAWLGRAEHVWFDEPEISSKTTQQLELEAVIDRSRSLVQSEGDQVDAEGTFVSFATWQRVRRFLLKQAAASVTLFRLPIPPPTISPADEGSIDVFWQIKGRELLLNFPAS